MPLQNGQYVAPTFVDGTAPALSAAEMNAMAGAVQGAVEYDRAQTLTAAQMNRAATNMGVLRMAAQTLTAAQQTAVLGNLGALSYNSQTLSTAQKLQVATNVGAVSYTNSQSLTAAQKTLALANIGAVSYNSQSLTAAQKTQARTNIGASAVTVSGVNVSVAANAWSSSSPYTATVSASGVTVSNRIVVGVGSGATATQYEAFADGQIICSAQGSGTITLKAFGDKPSVALPVSVLILT